MPKLTTSYLTRFLLLIMGCILLVTVATFLLSNYLSINIYSELISEDMDRAMDTGKQLITDYNEGDITKEDLQSSLNPTLNPSGVFLMLLDDQQKVLAYTNTAAPYFAGETVRRFIARIGEERTPLISARGAGRTALLLGAPLLDGQRVTGYVLVGKVMAAFDGASHSFRVRLFYCLTMMLVLIALASMYAVRRVARPANELMRVAGELTLGRLTHVDDDLPGEMGEIARALNHMTFTLANTISALRFEKETMTLILEGLTEGIIAIDGNGKLLHENKAIGSLLSGAAYARVLSALKDALREGTDFPISDKIVAGERVLQYVIAPLPVNEKRRRGVIALVRDITEQERLERTRYDYVANISHELRTPLASMRGIAEGLRDGLVTDEAEKLRYYNMIVSEVLRLSRLVNDMLELSSLQSNPAAFDMERIDPAEMLYELHDRSARLFAQNGRTLTLALPEEPLQSILSNEDRLTQVLTIFLDNALKYTPEGGEVWLEASNAQGGVRFCVRDTGVGMDEETMRRAFDRFHQAERGRSDKGSGLGLSIAKEILAKLDLQIGVESKLGEGSAFFFTVPGMTTQPPLPHR